MTENHLHYTGPPLLRLAGLKTSQLPAPSATADELRPFVTQLLQEAVPFIDTAAPRAAAGGTPDHHHHATPKALWKSKGVKTQPGSDARVEVTERVAVLTATGTASGAMEKDTWVCRRSVHADSAVGGSASWAEFVDCIRDRHAETEDAFTPGVMAHRTAVTWLDGGGGGGGGAVASSSSSSSSPPPPPVEVGGVRWGRFGLYLVEMKHKIPPPLKPRVFSVVQLIASAVGGGDGDESQGQGQDEFVVVSVTVDDFAEGALKGRAELSAEKGVVIGAYASVERVRRLPSPGGEIEWIMATTSDAKGVLPMWVQTRAVPGQVAKDVGMFLSWIAEERGKKARLPARSIGCLGTASKALMLPSGCCMTPTGARLWSPLRTPTPRSGPGSLGGLVRAPGQSPAPGWATPTAAARSRGWGTRSTLVALAVLES
ncbi:hypothetical protein VMCG_01149 [Cytospora schulzeri]|uniref:DUF3074 domain-containing protein n=1 Tax=Cytospora schulzeri TaxID=448051 RepID=A0A423X6W4_9PEZI|nr:hypothetical protein VMCG_01149 [Valsa malicola]